MPLIYGEDPANITMKVSKLNGILYPGGSGNYYEFGKQIFEQVKKINHDQGQFYPLWSTCLGFERFVQYTAHDKDILVKGLESVN